MLKRKMIEKWALIILSLVFLVGCVGGKSTQIYTPQILETPIAGIAPTSDKFPAPTEFIPQPVETETNPVAPPETAVLTPLYPLPGIELEYVDAANLDLVAQAGAYWIRRNALRWSLVEANEGERNWDALAGLEKELLEAANRGLQVVLIVSSTPEWAQKAPGVFCGPASEGKLLAFARFMYDVVKRYSAAPYNIKYWEMGNEPDVDPNLVPPDSIYGCWGDETDVYYGGGYYAEMLKQVYPQVKAADPEAQVLVGGLLLYCDPVNPPEGEACLPARYLEGILRSGGGDFFDGVSYHAYDIYSGSTEYGNANWNSSWDSSGPVLVAKARFLRSVLAAYRHPEKYLLNTEAGILCGRDDNDPQCQSEEFASAKAYYVAQANVAGAAESLRANIWYSLRGWRGTGLVDSFGKPNAAYTAFQFSATQLKGAAFVRNINDFPGVRGYEFQREGKRLVILWALDKQAQPVLFDRVPDAIYDVFGQTIQPEISIKATRQPIYVEWKP